MTTKLDYLFNITPPWISLGSGEAEREKWNPNVFYSKQGLSVFVRTLRGKKMRTVQALMDEFAAALQFFDGFGENWYALKDCLCYLDESFPADAYILVVEQAEFVLMDEHEGAMAALLLTLHETGDWWSNPVNDNGRFSRLAIPFHTIFNIGDLKLQRTRQILQIASKGNIPLRSDVNA